MRTCFQIQINLLSCHILINNQSFTGQRLSFVLKDEKNEDGFTVQLLPKDGFSILYVLVCPASKRYTLINYMDSYVFQ